MRFRLFGAVLAAAPVVTGLAAVPQREVVQKTALVTVVAEARGPVADLSARDFVVLWLPLRKELEALADGEPAYWSGLPALLERRGIASLDLGPDLAAMHRRCQAEPELGTLFVAAHLSAVGNHVVATRLARWLVERGHLAAPAR